MSPFCRKRQLVSDIVRRTEDLDLLHRESSLLHIARTATYADPGFSSGSTRNHNRNI